MPSINMLSVQSLLLEMVFEDSAASINTVLATGTGFVVGSEQGPLLITNRHNVTGRRQDNNEPISLTGGVPNRIDVWHNRTQLGQWMRYRYPLYDEDEPRWREHPTLGSAADFVALPIVLPEGAKVYPYSLSDPSPTLLIGPADAISVIGFPFTLTAGGRLAIWATGFVASEPEIDYQQQPVFLIDCRSRPGQSGSPVVASRSGGAVPLQGGDTMITTGSISNFLGIYSGRLNEQSDLGIVWKRAAIAELVASI